MAASINLTSSFPSGNQIPSNTRDNVFCTGANNSPALQWALTDISPLQIESYRLICVDIDAAGSGPGGKFLHWKVEDIPANLFSIGANQAWPVPVTIFPTDYPSGDNVNGWHGPCPPSLHNYQIYIEAIVLPQQIEKVGVGVVRSNLFLFTDDPQINIPNGEPSPLSCNSCPEGYTYNEETGLCESGESFEAEWTGNTISVIDGCFLSTGPYNALGLRLYEDVSNYSFPITGNWQAGLSASALQASYYLEDSLGGVIEILKGYATQTNPGNTTGISQPVLRSSLWGNGFSNPTPCENGVSSALRSGRINNAGIWLDPTNSGQSPCGDPEAYRDTTVQVKFCVNLEQTKQYLIGLSGDNVVRFYLDGSLIIEIQGDQGAQTAPFSFWHVIPITLSAGQHTITLEGYNVDQSAVFAGEIYDISLSEFQNLLLDPSNPGDPSYPDSATCGNIYEDLEPYIIFTTQTYKELGELPDIDDPQGQWVCNGEVIPDACGLQPNCSTINTVEPLPCCYQIQSCNNPEDVYLISLDENVEQLPLELNTVYKFSGDPALTDQGCFQLIDFVTCDGGELVNIVVEETVGDTCDACTPCYELTDCSNPEITLIIQWDPDSAALVENTAYVFDFAPDTCWTAELQFSPCEGTLYSPTNIVTTYIDCDECLKPCYKLTDCEEGYPTISTENAVFEVYVGKVIQWQDQLGENHCATVEKYICKDETWPAEPIVVLDCFDTCEDCLPKPIPEPIFELSSRSVRPGYNTPGCPPEYYEKVKCKFSEAVYQEMLSKRFGIETCCDIDERKYDIKHELLKLDALEDPYLCNPICATYNFSVYLNLEDTAEVQYVDCEGNERVVEIVDFEGLYSPEVCALTTFTPVIIIRRQDSSVEQYKFETSYHICCEETEFYEYEFVLLVRDSGDAGLTISYIDVLGVARQFIIPECPIESKSCAAVTYVFCGVYGSIALTDVTAPGNAYAINEACPDGIACYQDSRLTRLGDCP